MKRHDRAQGPSNALIRIKLSIHGALLCSGAIFAVARWAPEPPRRTPKKFTTTIGSACSPFHLSSGAKVHVVQAAAVFIFL